MSREAEVLSDLEMRTPQKRIFWTDLALLIMVTVPSHGHTNEFQVSSEIRTTVAHDQVQFQAKAISDTQAPILSL